MVEGEPARDALAPLAREDYERVIADEELMSMCSEIAVIDTRITDLLSRAESGESGRLWRQLSAQMRSVDAARHPEAVAREITSLRQIIDEGSSAGGDCMNRVFFP